MATVINSDTQFTDESTGELINNGFIYIGLDGLDAKLNPAVIYSERDLNPATALANPQRTGADGRSVNKIWVDGKYSMKVENFENVQKLNRLSLGELTQTGNTILTNVQGADALTANASPTITELVDRQVYILTAAAANTTAMTLTIDLTPTWPIKKHHDLDMVANDTEANQTLAVIFNDTDSVYELMTNSAIAPVDVATAQTVTGDKTLSGTTVISGATTLSGATTDVTGIATLSGDTTLSGKTTLSGAIQGASPLILEGVTDDAFKTTIAVTDPTASRTQTLQDKTGTLILNDDVSKIESITATVAGNDLTVGLNPTFLNFRSATLTDGAPVSRTVSSAITMVVPDTATLGAVSAQLTRVYELAIDNAGTVEPALVNAAGGVNLNEEGLISTTAISTGADSNNVIYSTTARTNVAYRVVGFVESTQATAGTWATAPSLIQGMGGNALTSMGSLGYGQTMQAVTRVSGATYYNTTGKPIYFNTGLMNVTNSVEGQITVAFNGGTARVFAASYVVTTVTTMAGSVVIPVGVSYVFTTTNVSSWPSPWEIR